MKILPLINESLFTASVMDILKSAEANDEIFASYFSIRNDSYGNLFLHHLYQAAARGVNIKLIIDDYGCLHSESSGTEFTSGPLESEQLICLEEVGVKIYNYHRIDTTNKFHYSNLSNWSNFSRRNHNKLFAFNLKNFKKRGLITGDSQWVKDHFNGNMVGNNIYIEDKDIYLDVYAYLNMLIHSEHVSEILYGNLDKNLIDKYENRYEIPCELDQYSWNWYKKENLIRPKSIEFVYSDIEFVKPKLRHTIQNYEIELLKRAKNKIIYSAPYFSPDTDLQKEFIKILRNKAINFKIIIGKYKQDRYLVYGVRKVAKFLLKFGINLYEFEGKGNIHYKDMIVDDKVFIKSSNGEGRSRFYNLESGVIIHSEEFSQICTQKIELDLNKSTLIDQNTRFLEHYHFFQKIKGISLCPFYYHHL